MPFSKASSSEMACRLAVRLAVRVSLRLIFLGPLESAAYLRTSSVIFIEQKWAVLLAP